MNEFSIVCRVLGSLFNRSPQDPVLAPLFDLIQKGKLQEHWPLEQDALLTRLRESADPQALAAEYDQLFVGENRAVSPYRSDYVEGATEQDVRCFLTTARHAVGRESVRQLRLHAACRVLAGRPVRRG
ncbi:TorA maturation chaperone TorD [Ewingella americana]